MKVVKKFCIIVLMLTVMISMCNNQSVYAEVNTQYGNTLEAPTINTEESADNNSLLGLLATCILTIARLLEGVVTLMVGLISSNPNGASFPWADLIIFNTIPVLDINFINPSSGSLLDLTGTIGPVIRNIYFTGLSIAVGFLSIVVAIMAIRMAISTIAAEKARYKESIVNLLTTLVLLFGVHFLLSLVFYVNEKMVEVASQIVIDSASTANITLDSGTTSTSDAIVSNLGEWFYKDAVSEHADGGIVQSLKNLTSTKPIPAVLYMMFVIQSIMFLFAYFKRFFYVVILSVLAPFVIIYDFLGKSLS